MTDVSRPLLLFDGDCGFCRAWVGRWQQTIGGVVDVAPAQERAAEHPEIPPERCADSIVLLEPGGGAFFGAAAVFRALAHAQGSGFAWWAYRNVPGFAPVSEWLYRVVATHREAGALVTRALWGAHLVPPGERLTAWIFVRLVGVVFLVAFASLAVQVRGLAGTQGILPASELLAQVGTRIGLERFYLLPTFAWLDAGDGFLVGLGAAGMLVSLFIVLGIAPRLLLLIAWAIYLSLSVAAGEFLWFQWDALLLECGVVAALLAPWKRRSGPRDAWAPAPAAVWLGRWLLFRLMFSSAAVKLASGDPSWRHLTALRFHYETQPLPPWTAWYAFHLPAWFQSFSAAAMFAIEGLVPFLVFAPRRLRMRGGAAIAFLQFLILITGNYGFFNLLSLALCILVLDDGAWPGWLARRAGAPSRVTVASVGSVPRRRRMVTVAAAGLALLGLCPLLGAIGVPASRLGPLGAAYGLLEPLRTVNPYGLFAVMTTRRLEIELEGSDDGVRWLPYGFRWKPGDPHRRPAFVPGHMPRLDWQMWFAALDPEHPTLWFLRFAGEVLQGSPPVLQLLARNPFPEHPPRYLRASLYRYRFTSRAEHDSTGAWWRREPAGVYLPPVQLEQGVLVPAPEQPAERRGAAVAPQIHHPSTRIPREGPVRKADFAAYSAPSSTCCVES